MSLPNISSMFKWINPFTPGGGPTTSQDFLQLIRQSDGAILGYIGPDGVPQGSLANPPTSLLGPGFINSTPTNNIVYVGAYNVNGQPGFTSGSNNIGGFMFLLPTEISTSNFAFGIAAADSADQYDIGIYGPYTGVETSLPLVCHTGPQTYASSDVTAETSWIGGPVTIPAGYYFLLFTTAGNLQGSGNTLQSIGLNSALSGGIPYLAFAPTVTTMSSGSTLPGTVALSVAFGSQPNHKPMQIQFGLF